MCMAIGSTAGGFVPNLWGAGQFSAVSILGSIFGGLAGIWIARRIDASF